MKLMYNKPTCLRECMTFAPVTIAPVVNPNPIRKPNPNLNSNPNLKLFPTSN